jgi:hypothetical protein
MPIKKVSKLPINQRNGTDSSDAKARGGCGVIIGAGAGGADMGTAEVGKCRIAKEAAFYAHAKGHTSKAQLLPVFAVVQAGDFG